MAPVGWVLLLFLAQLTLDTYGTHADATLTNHSSIQCRPDQAKALLSLKQSLFSDYTTLPSWQGGTDCCLWEGVGCSNSLGHVTVLDLGGCGFHIYGLHPVIFNLTSLRKLDLSMNNFSGYSLPAVGFERLTLLTHLNLSNSGFEGEIPVGISKLVNLISLDFSNRYGITSDDDASTILLDYRNWLSVANFQNLVANLSYLRELYLDYVYIHSSGEDWCNALAKSVPHLQVISLKWCNLYGPIHRSLSSLRSLTVINLQENFGISAGPFPDFFMDFVNLSVLQLAHTNLEGWFPRRIFQSKNLRVLDLSGNRNLSGNLPNFSNATSLETLRLVGTNFSYAKPSSSSSFTSLKELTLDGKFNGTFSWIGDLKNLTSLELYECDFYSTMPSSISNLKSLRSFRINHCNLTTPVLSAIGNLTDLQSLYFSSCTLHGSMPSAIGNLTNLRRLEIEFDGFLGPMPSSIGNLVNLRSLNILASDFSGPIPSTIGNLTNVRRLDISGCGFSGPIPSAIGNLSNLEHMDLSDCRFSGPIPSAVGQLKDLTTLQLQGNCFAGGIPNSIGNLTRLITLDLTVNCLSGEIPTSIFTLPVLQGLDLRANQLSGPIQEFHVASSRLVYVDLTMNELSGHIPRSFFELTSLTSLDISECGFSGPIPSAIGNLSNLEHMDISGCGFSGPIPSTIGNLSNLEHMDISDCEFYGPIPSAVGQLKDLTTLQLGGNSFAGGIPNWIGNLTRLLSLDLSPNCLSGEIPTYLFTLPALLALDLGGNQLSGPIQEFDAASSSLVSVDLSMNELSGHIPRSFFELTNLSSLDIRSNNFEGSVNLTSFWRLTNLDYLDLSNNKFSVMDGEGNNSSSTSLSGLTGLGLACCNLTKFPSILTRLNHVSYLDLSCNKLSGDIPNWIWETYNGMEPYLNLSYNMFTGMQLNSSVLPFNVGLEALDLSFNGLQGQIPMPNQSAQVLDYSNNNFSSVLPNFTLYLSETSYLSMSNNSISGHIPHSVCNSTLVVLDLSYNNFSGSIPSCLIENDGLSVLNLRKNHFEGTLPSNITRECAFQTIDLHGNKIEGQLPRALSNCSHLEVLDIGNNLMVDTFPSWLRGLSNLYVLILRSNRFYGSIADLVGDHQSREREYFSSLQIIDIASNNLSGNLSSEWFGQLESMMAKFNSTGDILAANSSFNSELYQDSTEITYKGHDVTFKKILTTLTAIDFSNNMLEGSIPNSIGRLVSLRVLNMSHNAFTGKIPAQLGGMTDLESLDLSCNQLSGEIPQELTNLTFLGTLNLSKNQLVGKIPQSRQFSTFDNSSFEGNAELCGLPLSNSCGVPPYILSESHVDKLSHVDVVLFLFVGLGFGVGFAAAILTRWGRLGKWFVKSA